MSSSDKGILYQLGTLLFLVMLFTLLGQGITFLIIKMGGLEAGADMLSELDGATDRQVIRLATAIGHIISFTVSAIVFLYMYHRERYRRYLRSDILPKSGTMWLTFFLLIAAYPIVIKLSEWNMLIPLPEWAVLSSDSTEKLLKGILNMESYPELLMSLFLVGVTPAIGEELLYRGIVQNKLIKYFDNEHLGIFTASFLFSLNHLQLERLLPFIMLGLVLGYAYHYTRSFWVPVILHFVNNSFQVMALYGSKDLISEIDMNDPPKIPNLVVILSIFITLGIIYYLRGNASENQYESESSA